MTRIRSTTRIDVPVEEVFDYVTTPGNWPEWHPSSLGVSGATDPPLEPGEQVTEDYLVAGRRGRVTWTVRERIAPRRWVIEGRTPEGGGGTITYALAPHDKGGGTDFECVCLFYAEHVSGRAESFDPAPQDREGVCGGT